MKRLMTLLLVAGCQIAPGPHPALPVSVLGEAPPLALDRIERPGGTSPATGLTPERAPEAVATVPGEIIVGVEAGQTLPYLNQAEIISTLPMGPTYYTIRVPVGQEAAAMVFYRGSPGIREAMANAILTPAAIPTNDPLLSYDWQYDANRADVFGNWAIVTAENLDMGKVTVAVLDSGVDPNHPDLAGCVLPGFLTTGVLSDTPPSAVAFDQNADSHGTKVAGVIAALRNNSTGAAGVAPGAKILPLKDVNPSTQQITVSGLLNGIFIAAFYNQPDAPFAWLQGGIGSPVSVLNISQQIVGEFGVRAAFSDAIDLAVAHGVSVVISTGNQATDVAAPANAPGAIAVGVTARYLDWELIAPYSNHGDATFISAPGNMIWSTSKGKVQAGGTDYAKAYELFNGTSAAAPFVAGVMATIYVKYTGFFTRNRGLTARAREKLRLATDDLGQPGWDPFFGWGRVNAKKALQGTF